jgi:hypothetical protein
VGIVSSNREAVQNGNTKIIVCFTEDTIQWSAVYQSKMLARTDKSVMIGTEAF